MEAGKTMVLMEGDALLEWLRNDREETFMEGVRAGLYQAELAAQASVQAPLTKKQAAEALGFSEGTIDNLRRRGELESYEYGGQVRIERAEIERFKRTHTNLFKRVQDSKERLAMHSMRRNGKRQEEQI